MKDAFGAVIAIIITIVSLFMIPMQYFADKQDMITQSYVYATVCDFVSDVQLNGYISQDAYNKFSKKLSDTDSRYQISMTHTHDVVYPMFNENGNAIKGTKTIASNKYEDDILDDLYDNKGVYYLEKGDKFSVTVKNTTRTMGQKLNSIFTGSSTKYAIIATYGGVIRNENY